MSFFFWFKGGGEGEGGVSLSLTVTELINSYRKRLVEVIVA